MPYDDTIAAIATPPGAGGVAIVRISGPDSHQVLADLFVPARVGRWRPFRMRYGRIIDANGTVLDDGLAVTMRAPRSFTGEDAAEVSCHGGPLVVQLVLARALACGARLAEPGEFTLRAFLNGRMDLAQAEATLDVIAARTADGLQLARAQLGGRLSHELHQIREALLAPLALVTAQIDFPEDDVPTAAIDAPLASAQAGIARLLAGADQGIITRQGARAVIIGLPNAGKSSLLNALLRNDRAIVTPIAGTTRDTLEETADIGGVPVVLVDTAGFAASDDPIEQLGIARSHQALAAADLALLVVDATQPIGADVTQIAALAGPKPLLLVYNKADLLADTPPAPPFAVSTQVLVSAATGGGIADLAARVAALLLGGGAPAERLVTRPRQRDALRRAADALAAAQGGVLAAAPIELIAEDLTAALAALGEITGDGVGDDLLAEIFSRFCIGK